MATLVVTHEQETFTSKMAPGANARQMLNHVTCMEKAITFKEDGIQCCRFQNQQPAIYACILLKWSIS